MRPLFPFYGSKWRDARYYPKPNHPSVIEPFAGSAGYSTYWEPEKVTLVDADPIICGVWSFLFSVTTSEILSLPDLQVGDCVDDFQIAQEAKWLIGFWLNRGSASPKKTKTAYSARTDRQQLIWSEAARQRIAASLHLLKRWSVRQGEYYSALQEEATWFIDPPYIDKGKYYRVKFDRHRILALWSRSRAGVVIVCEQTGADWLPFSPFREMKSSKGISSEVAWIRM